MGKWILLLGVLILNSCSTTLDFKQPGNRFYTPETTGEKAAVSGSLHYAQGIKTTVTEIYRGSIFSDRVTVNNEPSLDESRGLGIQGKLGVDEIVDLELTKDHDTPFLIGAKIQAYGAGTKQREDGLKLAFGAGVGMGEEESDTISITDSTDTRSYKATVDIFKWNFYSSIGYRTKEDLLFYISGYYTKNETESQVTSDDNQFNAFTREDDVLNTGANLGFQFLFNKGFVQIEVGRQKVKFAESRSLYATPVGVSLGIIN